MKYALAACCISAALLIDLVIILVYRDHILIVISGSVLAVIAAMIALWVANLYSTSRMAALPQTVLV
jgi:hypothetical protein